MLRAAGYGAQDIADTIRKLVKAGCEVGLHGIDAWLDSSKGRDELEEIRRLTGVSEVGVRMHWLYHDQQSPVALERAGASYDSTIGYNDTVGYRAGTVQAYKPLQTKHLLELPLHVMDTALFYPSYLELTLQEAITLLGLMVDNSVQFGGSLTINWHDRSIAPERLWDAPYRDLLQDLRNRGAWFATAGEAISWFRKRRSAAFEFDCAEPGVVRAKVSGDGGSLPGLRLRIHKPRVPSVNGAREPHNYVDVAVIEAVCL
jgi:peptidoglycan/xylan/chitin deacetylase (PgdA/CDA1 family)